MDNPIKEANERIWKLEDILSQVVDEFDFDSEIKWNILVQIKKALGMGEEVMRRPDFTK